MHPKMAVEEYFGTPEQEVKLARLRQRAVEVTREDTALRAPRSDADRQDGFSAWLGRYRGRLTDRLRSDFVSEFPALATQPADPEFLEDLISRHVWPDVELLLLGYAVRSQAAAWVRRQLGDAVLLGWPERLGKLWRVPLQLRLNRVEAGEIVLDADGNVIPNRSTTRRQLEERIGANSRPGVEAAPR